MSVKEPQDTFKAYSVRSNSSCDPSSASAPSVGLALVHKERLVTAAAPGLS